jgi:AcrR family transcriptional regulator
VREPIHVPGLRPGEPDGRVIYDPFAPIARRSSRQTPAAEFTGHSQRARRAAILAAIRSLLTESGCESVTVRRISQVSGYAVQTIYNLVGPRDQAITEAISEYSLFVGRTARPRADDPVAVMGIIHRWVDAIRAQPEFCRQANLIFFTDSRSIYYTFRDRQLRGMRNFLKRQQECGIIRADVNVVDLAECLVLLSSALWLEWSDRPFPLELLEHKLCSGCSSILTDKVAPQYRALVADWQNTLRRQLS